MVVTSWSTPNNLFGGCRRWGSPAATAPYTILLWHALQCRDGKGCRSETKKKGRVVLPPVMPMHRSASFVLSAPISVRPWRRFNANLLSFCSKHHMASACEAFTFAWPRDIMHIAVQTPMRSIISEAMSHLSLRVCLVHFAFCVFQENLQHLKYWM